MKIVGLWFAVLVGISSQVSFAQSTDETPMQVPQRTASDYAALAAQHGAVQYVQQPGDTRSRQQFLSDCAAGINLNSCVAGPQPLGCIAGATWSTAGTGVAHCVEDDPTCPPGEILMHDTDGNPYCDTLPGLPGTNQPPTGSGGLVTPAYTNNNYVVVPTQNGSMFNQLITLNYNTNDGTWSVANSFSRSAFGTWFNPSQSWEVVGSTSGTWTTTPGDTYQYMVTGVSLANGWQGSQQMISQMQLTSLASMLAQGCQVSPAVTAPINQQWPGGLNCYVGTPIGYAAQPSTIYDTGWITMPANSVIPIASVIVNNWAGDFDGTLMNYVFTIQVRDLANPSVVITTTIGLGTDEPSFGCGYGPGDGTCG